MSDFIIIGGGIVGLSVGMAIYEKYPEAKVTIIEKEKQLGYHQTGHNSGVIHSGIYYQPGSLKAKYARRGSQAMIEFCQRHKIEHDICGKVIVATKEEELSIMSELYDRGRQNGLSIEKIGTEELKEIEPHVRGLGAIHVPTAGIVNYQQVAEAYAHIIKQKGGTISLGEEVQNIEETDQDVHVETKHTSYRTHVLINCAGLQSDRIAQLTGVSLDVKIIPFRGEYYKLIPEKRHLVKNLIYPVPNPDFPFLGVHFTRMIGGEVEAGPNAVLSFKREGYRKTDIDLRDLTDVLGYKGFWKLARKYTREGLEEMVRSFSKKKFVQSLQSLIPEMTEEDLISGPSGVRAQALKKDGQLVDDFHIVEGKRSIHVCNAPSPAATASLEIGKAVVQKMPAQPHLKSVSAS
ncbi:L-2-hydroxyglutarate oxidase [Caldalkalibacillus salinus]|uniref:L-2-hydroxyglutarate oxidase n=1 Tax=Caldalkalibacillus salinus TaxID=2803787 RepID=UPI001924684D|nr:L-2-hydroxyglutarate oxidase [Caldalkalibacillus salinus]